MFKTFVYAAVSPAFAAAAPLAAQPATAYFGHIDSDKDGVVTIAEMKAAGVIK